LTTQPKAKRSRATGAKKGAPKGNNNAQKHGLWARNHPKAKVKGEGEIEINQVEKRRNIADDVIETLYDKFHRLDDIDQLCKCANSISLAITAANGCDRTLAIVSGKISTVSEAIEQLFKNYDPDDDSTLD
jgi:hypothetical protein